MFIKVEKEKVGLQFHKRDNANIALKKALPRSSEEWRYWKGKDLSNSSFSVLLINKNWVVCHLIYLSLVQCHVTCIGFIPSLLSRSEVMKVCMIRTSLCLLTSIVSLLIFLCNRYWLTEMHVDGFRFDLASIMTRGSRLSYKNICQILSDLVQLLLEINFFFFSESCLLSFLLCQQSLECS